ncbi:MAG: hypothetical protein RMX68_007530 [Aulosira sp. ZfuVER01]|nr:hypothetical protein [Aulosira sp. ZfuVER01]MDZ7998872.1 hypothetical protein [Aulosira sp. DedVER01a]MDZ8053612.1 hypothetical protein [Aulosira sp. ZfuCHP01]
MNLPNNHNFRYFIYLAVLTTLIALLANFNGTVTVQVTSFGLQVRVDNHSTGCLIDPKPQEIEPTLLAQKLA